MFFGIHNHTAQGSNLRLRDSTNRIDELIDYAHELGHLGLCITDHESITSHLDALKYLDSRRNESGWEGFKLGLGNEIYLCDSSVTAENIGHNVYPHFILVALNANGHKGIRELSTKAWTQNSFMHMMYRVPTYYSDLEEMMERYQGDIVGSSSCIGGALPRKILQYTTSGCENREQKKQSCIQWIEVMNDIFGQGYFFLELQPSFNEEQIRVNKELIDLSRITGTPYIITTDSHYLKKSDREIHKAYLNSQDGDREVDEFYATTYVMSEEEIHSYMDESLGYEAVQQGLDNTKLIYDNIEYYRLTKDLEIPYIPLNKEEPDEVLFKKYSPKIELLDHFRSSKYDSDRHLVREIIKYIDIDPYYQTDEGYFKINECLDYIKQSSDKMKVRWSAYLLQVADYVQIAWDCGSLVGPGRGSGVGFCLLHILGITQINPLREKTQMFPWRFLNPERASVLDIDLDIMSCMRDKVIQGLKNVYGEDRVSKVMTLSTEKSKSAILTAARGLGIDNDTASYIASLVVFDRGQPRTLKQMYYGDDEHKPIGDFVREMDEHPDLWETAQRIEGLVCGVGSHAGGVIIVDKPFTESTALMRTKSGDVITQFDLHGSEDVSLIKIDLLCIDALDKIYETLMLLLENNKIQWQGSLKATYEKYIGVYTLERSARDMWEMVWNHKVLSLFQMEKESGKQALALVKPTSVDDLAVINSVIRLMAPEPGADTPLVKFAKYKDDISLWYQEMDRYGLTKEEQKILEPVLKNSYGLCETQEKFMRLVQIPECGGFDLQFSDRLRKSIAKKSLKEYEKITKEYFEITHQKHCSEDLCNYVWNVCVAMNKSYAFNSSHTLAYSIIGLQELNLCYKYNPIYWQAANLIVDSGSLDEESNDSTNYGKMAVAIALIQKEGVSLYPPVVETADFGFKPDEAHNDIIFGFKAINGINTEVSQLIINNRPYSSLEEFCEKLIDTKLIKPAAMIKLIKAGCFTQLHSSDKAETMRWFLKKYKFEPCNKLGLAQFNRIIELKLIPEELKLAARMINFKKYVLDDEFLFKKYIDPEKKKIPKRGYHDGWYKLDKQAQEFFMQYFSEDSIVDIRKDSYIVSEKKFTKEVDQKIQPFKDWLAEDSTLDLYNDTLFESVWNENASGSLPAWSMEALCYYDGEHELEHVDEKKYGIINYFDLPEEPVPYDYYSRKVNGVYKPFPKFEISRIAGTVINADNGHHIVSLLTKYGVVNVKFNRGHYSYYGKQISTKLHPDDKKKTVIEKSWLKRGNLLTIQGIRQGDIFFPKIYKDTIYLHTVNLIEEVREDGTLLLQQERAKI